VGDAPGHVVGTGQRRRPRVARRLGAV